MSGLSSPPLLPDDRLAADTAGLAPRQAGRFSADSVQGLLADSCRAPVETASTTTGGERRRTCREAGRLIVLEPHIAQEEINARKTEVPATVPST
ncbi:hypothetical protein [Streptomyces resistomycificus]|uniref:Uncharacterized protein n=1 Tax=Streptomyces resistomycificus TaxID=67356 RepID=A0A0L8KSQ6_9ACTN|nr:hypothetical protein [Streptomyces resistomycificus]KOG28915.1 hypothetical protein ADK37_38280 [Streptomyces resistomycificus]KUN94342.1 hypothetical protein AQJ84_27045 [Streptomyces resistomycificus]